MVIAISQLLDVLKNFASYGTRDHLTNKTSYFSTLHVLMLNYITILYITNVYVFLCMHEVCLCMSGVRVWGVCMCVSTSISVLL